MVRARTVVRGVCEMNDYAAASVNMLFEIIAIVLIIVWLVVH